MSEDPYVQLGQSLKDLRTKAGINKSALARRISIHRRQIDNIESGKRRLDVIELMRLAKIYEEYGISQTHILSIVINLNIP